MRFYYDDNKEATWGTDKFSMKVKDILAWLEKHHTDPYNGVCFDCYGHCWGICAQKPIENVERKFRVGNIVKSKSQPMLDARKIISIDKDCYRCEDKGCIGFAWEDDYELVEQKPVE